MTRVCAARGDGEAQQAEFLVLLPFETRPKRVEPPLALLAAVAHPAHEELDRRQNQFLAGFALPDIDPERDASARMSSPKKPATGQKPRITKGRLARAPARQHSPITSLTPPGPSDLCGRISAAKTGCPKRSPGRDNAWEGVSPCSILKL